MLISAYMAAVLIIEVTLLSNWRGPPNMMCASPGQALVVVVSSYVQSDACVLYTCRACVAHGPCPRCFTAGENDVTVIFKPQAGGKRWQSLLRQEHGMVAGLLEPAVEQNYTVILGSHRNSRLKFEKNGVTHSMLEHVAGSHVSSQDFTRYWIDINNGVITVGTGAPGSNISYRCGYLIAMGLAAQP